MNEHFADSNKLSDKGVGSNGFGPESAIWAATGEHRRPDGNYREANGKKWNFKGEDQQEPAETSVT
jgi:hypothetical protein